MTLPGQGLAGWGENSQPVVITPAGQPMGSREQGQVSSSDNVLFRAQAQDTQAAPMTCVGLKARGRPLCVHTYACGPREAACEGHTWRGDLACSSKRDTVRLGCQGWPYLPETLLCWRAVPGRQGSYLWHTIFYPVILLLQVLA